MPFYRGGCALLLENYTEAKETAEVFSRLNHVRRYLRFLIQHKPLIVLKLFGGMEPDLFGISIKIMLCNHRPLVPFVWDGQLGSMQVT